MQKYIVDVDNLLALANVLNDFQTFNNELQKLISVKNDEKIIIKLYDISTGHKIINLKVRKFYKKYKYIIDEINKNTNLIKFIASNYGIKGNKKENYYLDYFYDYFTKNDLNKIKEVLLRIKQLKVQTLIFDENADFTKDTYSLNTDICSNHHVHFLDNIKIIPNSEFNTIKYTTLNSHYNISIDQEFNIFSQMIVNSLTFDTKTLPNSLDTKDTINKIINLSKEKTEEVKKVNNCVELNSNVNSISKVFVNMNEITKYLENDQLKAKLIQILNNMSQEIKKLEIINNEYINDTIETTSITKEQLEIENRSRR